MRSMNWFICAAFAVVLALGNSPARTADIAVDDILPENTLAAIVIPDLAAARAQAKQTKIAEMFSQPEIQDFLQPVMIELRTQFERVRKQNPVIPALADLDSALLSGEMAVGVCPAADAGKKPNKPPVPWVLLRPKDMAAFQRLLPEQLLKMLQAGEPLPLGPQAFLVLTKDRLLFCTDPAELRHMMARAKDAAAGPLSKAPAYVAVKAASPNAAGWLYVSPERIMALVQDNISKIMPAPEAERYKTVMQTLGMENTTAFSMALTFRNGMPAIEGNFRFKNASAEGIPALFVPPSAVSPKPEAFAIAAVDAPFVSAGYWNFAQVIPLIRKTALAANPIEAAALDDEFNETVKRMLQCDLQKDLMENIGPEYIAVQTPMDTSMPFSLFPGMVYSLPLKDSAKFELVLNNIGKLLGTLPEEVSQQYSFKKIMLSGNPTYYISGVLVPASPIFCVTKDRLLMGTSINALRRVMEQMKAPTNILTNQAFQQTIARVTGKPFDPAKLPYSFSYGIDQGSGTGSLMLASTYVLTAAGITAGLAEVPVPNAPPKPAPRGGNEAMEFLMRPAGQVLLPVASSIDLALWPDELFFSKFRLATGSSASVEPNAAGWRTELPFPTPSGNGASLMVMTSSVAIIAAVAIPSLLRSRMAANETAAAAGCKVFAEAQEIYHRTDWDKDGILEYAPSIQAMLKGPGGEDIDLVDRAFAGAEVGPDHQPVPKAGYYFKVLKGESKEGAKKSYLTKAGNNENMTLGYAVVAFPAEYDSTGRNCFIINHTGTIWQADLGPATHELIEKMTEFDTKYGEMEWFPAE